MKKKNLKILLLLLIAIAIVVVVYFINTKLDEEKTKKEIQSKYNDLWLVTKALKFDADIVEKDGQVELENIDYDEHELAVRIGAYNFDKGTDYTLDDMKKSIEAPNDDVHNQEKYLLDDFMEWYSLYGGGAKGKVAEYDKALGRDFEKLQKEYPEISNFYFGDLTYKQIQEVEKHLEDPSYEIDVTLWK